MCSKETCKKEGEKIEPGKWMIFFQAMMKMKNHQPQGENNRKKFLKLRKPNIGKINNNNEEEKIGNARIVKNLGMMRMVIGGSFLTFAIIVQSSTNWSTGSST